MLARTLVTSGTTLIVVVVLFLLGGEMIHNFALALIIGILIGTYSSIYVASNVCMLMNLDRKDLVHEGPKVEEEDLSEYQ
jgi:preprotein translocase subunit SecF